MGLLSSSLVANISKGVASTQGTSNVQSKQPSVLPKTSSKISGVIGSALGQVGGAVSSVEKEASSLLSSGEKYVENLFSSGAASFQSIFSGSSTSASKSANGLFTDTFKDTATPASTTVNTNVSDPVKTMMQSSNPNVSAYKMTTGSGVPVQVALSGDKTLADGSTTLTSTQVQTLRNRFQMDTIDTLGKSLNDQDKAAGVSSVYSSLFSSSGSGSSTTILGKIANTEKTVQTGLLTGATKVVTSVETDVGKVIGSIVGSVDSGLSGLIGDTSSGSTFSAVDANKGSITTKSNQVSEDFVNSIVENAKALGCTDLSQYFSDLKNTGVANALVSMVSSSGLVELLEQLFSCTAFSGTKNDTTLSTIATSLGGTQPAATNVLLSNMKNPSIVNTGSYLTDVVTTPSLNKSDTADLDTLFTTLQTDPKTVYSSGDTTANIPTYDIGLMSQTNSDVLDSFFGKGSVYSSLLAGDVTPVSSNGTLSF